MMPTSTSPSIYCLQRQTQTRLGQRYSLHFKDYLSLYWQLLNAAAPLTIPAEIDRIAQAQRDYDQYSAERDPASGLFSSYFGHDWSEQFLYGFLFEDAQPLTVEAASV